jgi:hypothetical protein
MAHVAVDAGSGSQDVVSCDHGFILSCEAGASSETPRTLAPARDAGVRTALSTALAPDDQEESDPPAESCPLRPQVRSSACSCVAAHRLRLTPSRSPNCQESPNRTLDLVLGVVPWARGAPGFKPGVYGVDGPVCGVICTAAVVRIGAAVGGLHGGGVACRSPVEGSVSASGRDSRWRSG